MTTQTNKNVASFTIQDVEFAYPRIGKAYTPTYPDGTRGVSQYTIQVRGLSDEMVNELKGFNIPLQTLEDGTKAITMKQYVTNKAGEEQTLNVLDADFKPIDAATVGAGSKGHMAGYAHAYDNESGKGYALRMTDIIITDKVEFVPETLEDRMERLFKFKG